MVLSDVIDELRGRGVAVTSHKIRHAVVTRRVCPKRDGAGNFQFSPQEVDALEQYVRNPPKCGRPPKPRELRTGLF
jgi:hypothetical protein